MNQNSATKVHTLKVAAPYFDALLSGEKTFEVRLNDRGFQKGDLLRLWECPDSYAHLDCGDRNCKPPREVTKLVTFVYSGDPRFGGVQSGYVVLGLGPSGVSV
jgi:hypothetical protein